MPTRRNVETLETIRCIRCAQEAPRARPTGHLCRPCEDALDGIHRGSVREKKLAREARKAQAPPDPPAPMPSPAQEAPSELEVLRTELEAVRVENALLTRGVNLLLGCVAEDLSPSRAMAIVTWEREWRMHRKSPGTTPPG